MRHLTDMQPRRQSCAGTRSALAIAALSLATLSLATLSLSTLALAAQAASPRLGPATPASFTGDCASLLTTLAGMPNTTITPADLLPSLGPPWRAPSSAIRAA
jgi:hypothetical protein